MSDDLSQKKIEGGDKQGDSTKKGNQPTSEIASVKISTASSPQTPLPHSINDATNPKRKREKSHPYPPNWCEKWTLWLEVAGVLGLAFYCWVNWKEWTTFDSERQTMENEFSNSIAANSNQLSIMQGQLDEMKRARELDERAWVAAFNGIYENGAFITNFSNFRIEFKNTGKTPAINVTNFAIWVPDVDYITKQDTPRPISNNRGMEIVSGETIAPDGISSSPTLNPIPNGDVQTMQKYRSYIFGTIWYDDIFSQHHWSQYCFQVTFVDGQFVLLPMGIHNSTDDVETNQTN